MGNEITEILKTIAHDDILNPGDMCGSVENPGTSKTSISDDDDLGSIYGFAVQLEKTEVEAFFNKSNEQKHAKEAKEWKSIGNNYYPLYWGKDKYGSKRVEEHLKFQEQTGSIHIETRKELTGKKVIYGLILVKNRKNNEKKVREEYPDIYKTKPKKT